MGLNEEEGQLVETGTFRVDTERMLRVLAKYQLETPLHSLRELVRCAVLNGAAKLQLSEAREPGGIGFLARFGGRAFTAGELSDVYAPLLAGDQGRGRHLAAAVLALAATRPARLTLSSGGVSVELAGVKKAAAPEPGGSNSLLVLWASEPAGLPLRSVMEFPRASEAALACCPVTVRAGNLECPGFAWRPRPERGIVFKEGGLRGRLEPLLEEGSEPLTGDPPPAVSTVCVHAAGVYAETVKMDLPYAPALADIGDDGLLLDASLSKCTRDARFAALRPFLEKKALELIRKEAAWQETDFGAIGNRLSEPGFRRLWREGMSGPGAMQKISRPEEPAGILGALWKYLTTVGYDPISSYRVPGTRQDRQLIAEAARRTWWLQDACRRALGGKLKPGAAPEAERLRTVPVLFSTFGEPLSVAKLRKRRQAGRFRVSEEFYGEQQLRGGREEGAVWIASGRDREFLNAFVPKDNWDV